VIVATRSETDDDTEAASTTRKLQISTDLEESEIKAGQQQQPPVGKVQTAPIAT
jgi:hypothetical protein